MQDRISVRQWQELYRAGAFEKDNEQTRELAGWGRLTIPCGPVVAGCEGWRISGG